MPSLLTRWRSVRTRDKRMLVYLLILAAVAAWRFIPRSWHPTSTLETAHYAISSTATPEQTDKMAAAVERLHRCYGDLFSALPPFQANHPRLKMRLYKDRDEMRRVNPGMGWAEAFYRHPCCEAYFSANEANPYHWMLHEAVHQLNREVAQLPLEKWLDEGVAEYLSTSRIREDNLQPGTIDPYTYPVWWMSTLAKEGELTKDLANGSIIPLRAVITDKGGPSMSANVNLYYLHWWTLAHYVFQKHPDRAKELLVAGGRLEHFERLIGPVDAVQEKWYAHVLRIKSALQDASPHFQATGELPRELSLK